MKILGNNQKAVMQMAVDMWIDCYTADVKEKERNLRVSLLREASRHQNTTEYDLDGLRGVKGDIDAIIQLWTKISCMEFFRDYLSDVSQIDLHSTAFANHVKTVSVATVSVALECQRDLLFDRLQDVIPTDASLQVLSATALRKDIKDLATQFGDAEQLVQYFQDFADSPIYNRV